MKHVFEGHARLLRFFLPVLAFAVVSAGSSPARGGGAGNAATGSGHVAVWEGQPYWDSYAFTARSRDDGSVSGRVRYFDKVAGYRANGDVFNLVVSGNKAKIGFQAERGGGAGFRQGFFVVVDGGEGNGAACCDSISWLIVVEENGFFTAPDGSQTPLAEFEAMTPDEFVAWEQQVRDGDGNAVLAPQLFAYVNGNIQVR
jgi:hypothetical protein